MLRNRAVAGHFALSDQGGVVLAYFKATECVLWHEGRAADRYLETSLDSAHADYPHTVWKTIDAELRRRFADLSEDQLATLHWRNLAQGNKTAVDSFAISRALTHIGWTHLADSPVSTAACCLVRCGAILTFPLNLAIRPPAGVDVNRLRSAIMGGAYLILCPAALRRLIARRVGFREVCFPLASTVALLLATTPQVDPRFRVPMVPLLIVIVLLPKARRWVE